MAKKQRNTIKPGSLQHQLCSLKASGAHGFEGLVRDLFERFLGQSISLMQSGTQGGGDASTSPAPNRLNIIWEDKRYSTTLPVDELTAKFQDACRSQPDMDLWIVVTTIELSTQHIQPLQSIADQNGVGFWFLDWPSNDTRLSSLAALCAPYSDLLAKYGIAIPAQEQADIQSHALYQARLDELKGILTTPALAYVWLRKNSMEYFTHALADRSRARRILGCNGDILSHPSTLVPRASVFEKLDEWWNNSQETVVLVHGKEGRGKSWAVFSWLHRNIQILPLLVVIPAQNLSSQEIQTELAKAIKQYVHSTDKNEVFFQKKIQRIQNNSADGVSFLLVIDGLNQNLNSSFNYENLLSVLNDEPWRGKIRVIITSRTGFVERNSWLNGRPKKIRVAEFSESERDQYFSSQSVNADGLKPEILKIASVPRYASLVVKHLERLKVEETCTPAHLFLLDCEDRLSRKNPSVQIAPHELACMIHELARKASISLSNIKSAVQSNTIANADQILLVVNELVQDSWLQDPQRNNTFHFSPEWSSTALALMLQRELAITPLFEEQFATFIEPMNEADEASDVIYGAIWLCLADNLPDLNKAKFLTQKLLERQNIKPTILHDFWTIAVESPTMVLNLLETNIFDEQRSQLIDFLKSSLLYASQKNSIAVEPMLRQWIHKWIGHFFIRNDAQELEAKIRVERDAELNLDVLKQADLLADEVVNRDKYISPHEYSFLSSLQINGYAIDSIIKDLISVYRRPWTQSSHLEWIFRWSFDNQARDLYKARVDAISGLSPKAKEFLHSTINSGYTETHWRKEIAIGHVCLNPFSIMSPDDAEYAWGIVRKLDWDSFNRSRNMSSDQLAYHYLRSFLAREVPQDLQTSEARIYNSKNGLSLMERAPFLHRLNDSLLILYDNPGILQDIDALLQSNELLTSKHATQFYPLISAMWLSLSCKEQLAFIATIPDGMPLNPDLIDLMDSSQFNITDFIQFYQTSKTETARVSLLYIGFHLFRGDLPKEMEPILLDACDSDKVVMRRNAIYWLINYAHLDLQRKATEVLTRFYDVEKPFETHGLLYLRLISTDDTLPDILNWCHPKFISLAIAQRGNSDFDIQWYGDLITTMLSGLQKGDSTYKRISWSGEFHEWDGVAFDRILERKPEIIPLLEQCSLKQDLLVDDFPFTPLFKSWWAIEPQRACKAWIRFAKRNREYSSILEEFSDIPFEVAQCNEEALRDIYSDSNTDKALLGFAYKMQLSQKHDLLGALIIDSLNSEIYAIQAKGIITLGFCLKDSRFDSIWEQHTFSSFVSGWVKAVYIKAKEWYERSAWTQHWYNEFVGAATREKAFGFYVLFKQCLDKRVWLWVNKKWELDAQRVNPNGNKFFNLDSNSWNEIMKKQAKELGKTFGFEKIANAVKPWWDG